MKSVDLNVQYPKMEISDTSRIETYIPTIITLVNKGQSNYLSFWAGGKFDENFSLGFVSESMSNF